MLEKIKNIGVQHSLEKNETATMFVLKNPVLVEGILPDCSSSGNMSSHRH